MQREEHGVAEKSLRRASMAVQSIQMGTFLHPTVDHNPRLFELHGNAVPHTVLYECESQSDYSGILQ